MKHVKVRKETAVQLSVCKVITLLAGLIGFRIGSSYGRARSEAALGHGGRSLASMQCQVDESESAYRGLLVENKDSEFISLLSKNHLEDKWHKMLALFSPTEVGYALAQATTLVEFGPSQENPEGRVLTEVFKFLESDPRETFTQVQDAFDKLGPDSTSERQFLIQLVTTRLDLEPVRKLEFLSDELNKAITIADVKQNKLNCSMLLLAMMGLEDDSDPVTVDAFLRKVLASQPSYHLRSYLLSIYESKYREPAKHLRLDLGMVAE